METLFTKINRGEIPGTKLYQDNYCFVILDINPVVKAHALVIANEPYEDMASCPDEVLSHLILVAKMVEKKMTSVLKCDGSNIMINNKPASGQEVPHIHVHVIPRYKDDGKRFTIEHDKYSDGEMAQLIEKLRF